MKVTNYIWPGYNNPYHYRIVDKLLYQCVDEHNSGEMVFLHKLLRINRLVMSLNFVKIKMKRNDVA